MDKCWHVVDAVEDLGKASVSEVKKWLDEHYPGENHSDARADLTARTVNAPSRVHHDKTRTNWQSDSGHKRDVLFCIRDGNRVYYEIFKSAKHGHWNIQKNDSGKWIAVSCGV
jgi:hypothetical protein